MDRNNDGALGSSFRTETPPTARAHTQNAPHSTKRMVSTCFGSLRLVVSAAAPKGRCPLVVTDEGVMLLLLFILFLCTDNDPTKAPTARQRISNTSTLATVRNQPHLQFMVRGSPPWRWRPFWTMMGGACTRPPATKSDSAVHSLKGVFVSLV